MKRNTMLEKMTAVAFLAFIGVFLYYSFWPFKVTTLHSIGIDAAEYCRGEWVNVEMDFTKHRDIKGDVKWYIVDGIVYQLDSPGISRPEGENKIMVSKQIPHPILPGEYNLRIEMEYRVHPLHSIITDSWNTPKFTVKGDKDCPTEDELELNESAPIAPEVPTPSPEIILYPAYAQEPTNVRQETNIVAPDREEPKGEPQTPVPPKEERKPLLERVKDLLK